MKRMTRRCKNAVRVLVVDNSEQWLQFMTKMLGRESRVRVVGTVSEGPDAIAMAETLQPDLVLMDLYLPILSGIEVAQAMRKAVPRTKILFVSEYSDQDLVQTGLAAGGQGYVLKASATRELLPAIEAVHRGERYVSSALSGLDERTAWLGSHRPNGLTPKARNFGSLPA